MTARQRNDISDSNAVRSIGPIFTSFPALRSAEVIMNAHLEACPNTLLEPEAQLHEIIAGSV
jgi:hypothetical protein